MDCKKELAEKARSQIDRFRETARALGCNEDGAAFDANLKSIMKTKSGKEKGNKTKKDKST